VYQSLLHITWIDEFLENVKTVFVDLYKDKLKGPRSRVADYPFDKYFDQLMQEMEGAASTTFEDDPHLGSGLKKDSLVQADTGGPPPPPIPGLLPGAYDALVLREVVGY